MLMFMMLKVLIKQSLYGRSILIKVKPTFALSYLISQLERIPGLPAEILDPGLNRLRTTVRRLLDVLQGLIQQDVAARIRVLHDHFPEQQTLAAHAGALLNKWR